METDYLEENIKDLIEKYPSIASLLEEFDIGCVNCSLATCKFKDIIDIHNLSKEDETTLITRIFKILDPEGKIEIPKIERKPKDTTKKTSLPIQMLVDEHKLIKRLLALIPSIGEQLTLPKDKTLVEEMVDFIKSYADKFHHAKEEDILFEYFDKDIDILKVMYADHDTGRGFVKEVLIGVDENDKDKVCENLNNYRELLTGHIKKEDEILYPWMESNLSIMQIGDMYSDFQEVDESFNAKKYEDLIKNLEEKYL